MIIGKYTNTVTALQSSYSKRSNGSPPGPELVRRQKMSTNLSPLTHQTIVQQRQQQQQQQPALSPPPSCAMSALLTVLPPLELGLVSAPLKDAGFTMYEVSVLV
jgi:hypothetical protein